MWHCTGVIKGAQKAKVRLAPSPLPASCPSPQTAFSLPGIGGSSPTTMFKVNFLCSSEQRNGHQLHALPVVGPGHCSSCLTSTWSWGGHGWGGMGQTPGCSLPVTFWFYGLHLQCWHFLMELEAAAHRCLGSGIISLEAFWRVPWLPKVLMEANRDVDSQKTQQERGDAHRADEGKCSG